MNVLMHKQTGNLVLGHPWWDPIQVEHDEKFYEEILPEFRQFTQGRKIARGLVLQVGWLIQNQNGVWFGVNNIDGFEDLGEA